jgi:hypothetical protein
VSLAEKVDKVLPKLIIEIHSVHLCIDSTILLSWISSLTMRWNTVVANTVADTQKITNISDWKHVTMENPADLISQGLTHEMLVNVQL